MRVPLRVPWQGATERDVLIVSGPAGWGEASPMPGFDCHPDMAYRSATEAATVGWPPPRRRAIPVNATVPAVAPRDAARLVGEAAAAGIDCFKIKVGTGEDVDRVAAVRDAAGAAATLRVDANGAWDVETARTRLAALARFHLELAEQPVAGLDDLARLRRLVHVPLAADEAVRDVQDARRLKQLDAADALVVKVQPLGGVRGALAVIEEAGIPAIVSSMIETSVGLAAGAALAACLPDLPFACGLATATMLAADITDDPLLPHHGTVDVRRVAPNETLLERFATSESTQ
ncbi:MAG TPA: o-succinylbenzoate synthase [Acidimicrobiales bacterium]|nr:o-succinylbenzoate synthase [Acidimicrobiales bacterium]